MRKYNEYMVREGNFDSQPRQTLPPSLSPSLFSLHWLTATCLFDLQIHAGCARRKLSKKANSILNALKHFLQRLSEKANSYLTH